MDSKRQCLKEPRAAGRRERVASESDYAIANYLLVATLLALDDFFFFFSLLVW